MVTEHDDIKYISCYFLMGFNQLKTVITTRVLGFFAATVLYDKGNMLFHF